MAAIPSFVHFDPEPFYTEPNAKADEVQALGAQDHPLLQKIQANIHAYRSQSPNHFLREIVTAVDPNTITDTPQGDRKNQWLKVNIGDQNCENRKLCRPLFRKHKPTGKVQISHRSRWILLPRYLAMRFPPTEQDISTHIMDEWWDYNGKTFNWMMLPTELKLKILQCCVERPGFWTRAVYGKKHRKNNSAYEILDQLGSWRALLRVSAEIRADTLRVILVHNDNSPGGLGISSNSSLHLENVMYRLGMHYQITEPNGVPVSAEEKVLAYQYLNWPKMYPHLSRFATFRHGIRRLRLKFDYLDALHFFKVTVGNLHEYRHNDVLTCDIFEKLPNLNGVTVSLPTYWWIDDARQRGPQLFHDENPCVRILHRFIYERAATELAPYENSRVIGFMGQEEVDRFQVLLDLALSDQLKTQFSDRETDGGVPVPPEPATTPCAVSKERFNLPPPKSDDGTFPPYANAIFRVGSA